MFAEAHHVCVSQPAQTVWQNPDATADATQGQRQGDGAVRGAEAGRQGAGHKPGGRDDELHDMNEVRP